MRKKMSFIIKTIRFIVSLEFFIYLLCSGALWVLVFAYYLKLGLWDAVNLMPSKVFLGILFLNRLIGFISEIFGKKRMALISTGILIALIGLFFNYAMRFEGIASLGETEGFSSYERQKKGLFAKPQRVSITIKNISGNPLRLNEEGKAELSFEGKETVLLSSGQYKKFKGVSVGLLTIEPAPRVLITDKAGQELYSIFVKLRLYPQGTTDYFTTPALPHRFYVSLTGREDKPFNLKVMRGKIVLSNKDISTAEEVEFEGFMISFQELSKWAEIKIKYYPGNLIILIGLVIGLIGSMAVFLNRKRGNVQ